MGDSNDPNYNPDILRLVRGSLISDNFIALSHCWGESQRDRLGCVVIPLYCTTRSNFDHREAGFSATDLPQTFLDAIKVARGLGVQYLWIDSLCIIQGDDEEWRQESRTMQDVYTSAYCTIAATSALDSNSGFLRRYTSSEYLYVRDGLLGRKIFVCTNAADFDIEVDDAQLNKRAWVMQERFLSCRTIHFGANQMYWECGEGVYCEDLTQLKR